MDFPPTSSAEYQSLESSVARLEKMFRIQVVHNLPNVLDRVYAQEAKVREWQEQVLSGDLTGLVVQTIENGYREGTPMPQLAELTLETAHYLRSRGDGKSLSPCINQIDSPKAAHKYILALFAFRRLMYMRLNPVHYYQSVDSRRLDILETLPVPQAGTLEEMPKPKFNWLGTQTALAALFITLKRGGWIEEYTPYSIIERAFSNTKNIDQAFRPALEDGEPTYPKIPKKDFTSFEQIKPNKKSKN